MKGLLALGTLLLMAQDAPFLGDSWSMFCTGEKATGFNYRSGQWVETTFKPEKYMLTRKPDRTCEGINPLTISEVSEGFFVRETCVNMKKLGEEESFLNTTRCNEYYVKSDSGWIRSLSCDGIFARINAEFDGEFLRQVDSTIMRSATDRDSIVVEVGRCALLTD